MLQLHIVSFTYLATQLWLTLDVARSAARPPRSWLIGCLGVFIALCFGYAWALKDTDIFAVLGASGRRLSSSGGFIAVVERLPEMLGPAWSSIPPQPLALIWAVLSMIGLTTAIRRWSDEVSPYRGVLVQFVLGLSLAVLLAGLAAQARYLTACIPALFVLAGVGLHRVLQTHSMQRRWGVSLTIAICSVMGSWFGTLPLAKAPEPARQSAPSLLEQTGIIEFAREHGLQGHRLEARLHGPVYGGLTALRWVDFSTPAPEAPPLDGTLDLFTAPLGFPGIPPLESTQILETGADKTLVLGLMKRRYRAISARIDTPCPISFPYRWGPLTSEEYREFDVLRGVDIERCRHSRSAPLVVEVQGVDSESLYVLLDWFDIAKRYSEAADITILSGGRLERVSHPMLNHLALYRVHVESATVRLSIAPLDTIASIDLY